MAKRVFITYTPFHILTACGLASQLEREDVNILIFFKDFPNSEVYYDAIMEWKANPFKDVVVMDAGTQHAQKSLAQRFGFSRHKLNMVKRYWRDNLKDCEGGYHVYTFNDDTVESQFLYSRNERERNYYLEDGFSSYYFNPYYKNLKYHAKKLIRKALFGPWVERPYPYGTSKKVSKIFSFFPECVVEPLKTKELVQLSPTIFANICDSGLIDILKRRFRIGDVDPQGLTGIILFPFSFQLEALHLDLQTFTRSVLDIFDSRGREYADIYMKCHPREPDTTRAALAGMFPRLKFVENSTSAEILFLLMRNKLKGKALLVGSYSTAFITAKVILGDDVEIVCVLSNIKSDEFPPKFWEKMKITVKSSV